MNIWMMCLPVTGELYPDDMNIHIDEGYPLCSQSVNNEFESIQFIPGKLILHFTNDLAKLIQ